jgi:predicted nucleic acid-binding protein
MNRCVLVDTDIAIDFLRGDRQAVKLLKKEADFVCFSAITVAEIYSEIRNKNELAQVLQLFSIFPVLAATGEIAREAGMLAGRYRASHSVQIPDAIIAATCLAFKAELLTLNVKHYPMFAGLKPPYKKQNKANPS